MALYGVKQLIAQKKAERVALDGCMSTDEIIRDREELAEQEVPAEQWRQAELEINLIEDEGLRERWRRTVQRQARLRQWKARHGYKVCERCGVLHPDMTRLCFACRVATQDHIYQG